MRTLVDGPRMGNRKLQPLFPVEDYTGGPDRGQSRGTCRKLPIPGDHVAPPFIVPGLRPLTGSLRPCEDENPDGRSRSGAPMIGVSTAEASVVMAPTSGFALSCIQDVRVIAFSKAAAGLAHGYEENSAWQIAVDR